MKKTLLFILLLSTFAAAQEQRYDNFAATLTSASGIGNLTQVIPNATITVFNQPAVGVSCAGGGCVAATTFTSRTGGTPCGGGLPLTRPTSTTCIGTADASGNFGFWAAAGAYQYCVAATNFTTTCFNVILGPTLDGGNPFTGLNTFVNSSSSQSVTFAPLAAAGSTSTTVCASGWTCTPDYGQITLSVSGAGIASGDQLNITWSTAGDHIRVCALNVFDSTAAAMANTFIQDTSSGVNSTTKAVLFTTTALTTAHVYMIMYVCR